MARRPEPPAPPRRKNWVPESRAIRLEDMDEETRRAVRENWADMGMARTHVAAAKAAAQERTTSPTLKPEGREKAKKSVKALSAIEPHVQDIPITTEGATQARVERVRQGRARAKDIGTWTDPHTGWELPALPEGTGWYFHHHADIASAGREHGFSKEQAITVTTGMSPNNHPEIEKRAGRAIMDMVANQDDHTVHMTPDLHRIVNQRLKGDDLHGEQMPQHWVGQHVKLSDMDAKHIAAIGSVAATMRNKKQPIQSSAPFEDLGAARAAGAAYKGIEHLRGQRSAEDVIDPHSAPKVWSYRKNVLESEPGSQTHLEYLARAQDYQRGGQKGVAEGRRTPPGMHVDEGGDRASRMRAQVQAAKAKPGTPEAHLARLGLSAVSIRRHPTGQHSLPDYRPLRTSDEGVLAKQRDTAEDSWMQSISTRQDPRSVREGGEPGEKGGGRSQSSIAKTVVTEIASDKRMRKSSVSSEAKVSTDARAGNSALRHAVENHATRSAAEKMGLPAVFVQETGWSEQRIRAEKSPEYRKQLATEMNLRSLPKQPPPLGRQYPNAQPMTVTPIHHAAAKALYDRVVGGGTVAPHEIEHVEQMRRNAG